MVKVAIEGHESMAPFMDGYRQLYGVGKLQAVQDAEAGREHRYLRIYHAQVPSGIRAEEAAIALGQGILTSLEGTAHYFCQSNRSHNCEYSASIDGSEDWLKLFPKIVAFQHIYDGVGVEEN
jgi:hypothetical protein